MSTRWEYLSARQQWDEDRPNPVTILLSSQPTRMTAQSFIEVADELGEEGWELVSANAGPAQVVEVVNDVLLSNIDYIFKRPKA